MTKDVPEQKMENETAVRFVSRQRLQAELSGLLDPDDRLAAELKAGDDSPADP